MAERAKVVILSSLLLLGCAQQMGYTPTLDVRDDPNAHVISRDLQECEQLAEQAAGNTATEIVTGASISAAIGVMIGAAIGAVNGAMSGNSAAGAMIGGATGGLSGMIGGAIGQGFEADANYQSAYKNCMAGRGHRVIE